MKKFLTILFLVLMITIPNATALGFSGLGTGTSEDPYQITDVNQLQEMKNDVDAHYILMNNIDASETSTWNSGEGFIPIADLSGEPQPFTGSLDGQGYVISDLYVSNIGSAGLFFATDGCTIENLGLENVDITGAAAGAFIGDGYSSTITNCYAEGTVEGDSYVGGFAARTDGSTITNCYSNVEATHIEGDASGFIEENGETGSITNCYYNSDLTSSSFTGTPLTDSEMQQQSNFVGWDFVDVWTMNTYPKLQNEGTTYSLSGYIINTEGNPINDVFVSYSNISSDIVINNTISDETGYYEMSNISTGNYIINTEKDGFLPDSQIIDFGIGDLTNYNITLTDGNLNEEEEEDNSAGSGSSYVTITNTEDNDNIENDDVKREKSFIEQIIEFFNNLFK